MGASPLVKFLHIIMYLRLQYGADRLSTTHMQSRVSLNFIGTGQTGHATLFN